MFRVCRGKGLFTVKGEMGFMARDVPRSCLRLLRSDEVLEENEAKANLNSRFGRKKGAVEKAIKMSRRERSYQKALEVVHLQHKAVS